MRGLTDAGGALARRDLRHVWHPCSQMTDYDAFPPVEVACAEGAYLILADGRRIVDGISSWWCKSLGHGHPRVREAVTRQMARFEHVIGANTCFEPLVGLSERLAALLPPLSRVFYAGDGSTAMEVAMKMSLQFHAQSGAPARRLFASLSNGYHGESLWTLALGDLGLYSAPFEGLAPQALKLAPVPYRSGPSSPGWGAMEDEEWRAVEALLAPHADALCAVVVEPVLQGAGGMRVYSPDLLRRLRRWTASSGVHLVADEIMTGIGRTGRMLACEHAGVVPDFLVLSKGLTSGWVAFSAVVTTEEVYSAFLADYREFRAFMHSNTYWGNAIGAAAAMETLRVMEDERIPDSVAARAPALLSRLAHAGAAHGCLANPRGVGFAAAADIVNPADGQPFPAVRRTGFLFYKEAMARGALLRPLGDTIYFLPPLNAPDSALDQMAEVASAALGAAIAPRPGDLRRPSPVGSA